MDGLHIQNFQQMELPMFTIQIQKGGSQRIFVINDNDMPIVVAQKIINGTMPLKQHFFADDVCETVTDSKLTKDMFDLEEIKEREFKFQCGLT